MHIVFNLALTQDILVNLLALNCDAIIILLVLKAIIATSACSIIIVYLLLLAAMVNLANTVQVAEDGIPRQSYGCSCGEIPPMHIYIMYTNLKWHQAMTCMHIVLALTQDIY